ncbi:histidine phosphatase family protein [Bifidobacterium sp. CP2]|uniref:histidine phosphatase family protein n=1 Tax=Bifidobacterium TaxID=1678 RepID=UPI001BDD6568|nr:MULTISPECIES: histidine phosphatase family protein [Bifidobacterium]MBT1181985.1 histidine phosphatase family protein [Bifidobacterium sp. CP2]MBW3081307.1 histidine phosphatase family protein [Bifidobacterium saguinibicoloris]
MSEHVEGGTVAVDARGGSGFLVLLRHGQTAWSESGQHTGRTNVPLTSVGREQAAAAGERLRAAFPGGFRADCVFSSPLKRAQQTAELAGFAEHGTLDGIAEWDYGRAEGRTRQRVREMSGFDWDVWRDGPQSLPASMDADWTERLPEGGEVQVHAGTGETVEEAAARARGAIAQVTPLLEAGHDVLLVAHAHILRILTSQWLGVDPRFARLLRLDTAHYSVLSRYKGDNVIERWNC